MTDRTKTLFGFAVCIEDLLTRILRVFPNGKFNPSPRVTDELSAGKRINNKEYPNVSLNVVGDRKEPGLTGMKKICLYEATIKCGKKIQKMRSEHLGELQSWIEREVEPKMAT